jgi:hypothetical protein
MIQSLQPKADDFTSTTTERGVEVRVNNTSLSLWFDPFVVEANGKSRLILHIQCMSRTYYNGADLVIKLPELTTEPIPNGEMLNQVIQFSDPIFRTITAQQMLRSIKGELYVIDIYLPIEEHEYERLFRCYRSFKFYNPNALATGNYHSLLYDERFGYITTPTVVDAYALLLLMKRCGYTPPPIYRPLPDLR